MPWFLNAIQSGQVAVEPGQQLAETALVWQVEKKARMVRFASHVEQDNSHFAVFFGTLYQT